MDALDFVNNHAKLQLGIEQAKVLQKAVLQ
jgi:hypothetical protein